MAMAVGEWMRGPTIGWGSSATVSIAVDRGTGAVFAVKSVEAAWAGELLREQSILRGLSSPYVVRCLGSSGGASDVAELCDLFLEYAPGGSLADEIRRCGGRCEEGLIRLRARDVLHGLVSIHTAGIAHCDFKGRNVLIGANGCAMIADFGCARRVGLGDAGAGIDSKKLRGGTPMFMAPEVARGEEQGTASDIWGLGCTVIEMATGGSPWPRFADAMSALRHVALSGEVPEIPQWLSEDGKDFLARCLRRDPRERWTAEQLLQHQFVAVGVSTLSFSSVPGIGEKEMFVSPKSVLDQAFWDDSTADTIATTTAPTDRLRELVSGAPVALDWTWDASWITIHGGKGDNIDEHSSQLPELEAGADSYPVVRFSAAASDSGFFTDAERAFDTYGSHGLGNIYGDAIRSCSDEVSDSFSGGNHVVSDCNIAITSNGFFQICSVTFVLSCPSWPLTFRMFLSFFFFPCSLFSSVFNSPIPSLQANSYELGAARPVRVSWLASPRRTSAG